MVAEQSKAAITLTDGTMTIKFGNAGHLSGQNVSSGGAAAGQTTMDSGDADVGVGAMVGGFHGVSPVSYTHLTLPTICSV